MLKNEELTLDDSVKMNKNGKPILGVLRGPCADFINATRNGRKYDESLWEKVFSDPIVTEYFNCGGIPGELDHPTDRTETCSEKIAIMMPEPPKKDGEGHLIATFDILDTPNGRIAYTLAKYGYKLGISSRGSGDTYPGSDGDEHVDEDSYDFQAFDLVLLPAVKAARLEFEPMQESLDKKKMSFKKAINESLKKSTVEEKKIMYETLNRLGIEYSPERVNIDSELSETVAAVNNGAKAVRDLQESIKKQRSMEKQITELQEKLSVCYAKETEYEALIESRARLKKKNDDYKAVVESLQTKVAQLSKNSGNTAKLSESLRSAEHRLSVADRKIEKLTESVRKRDSALRELNEEVNSMEESINEMGRDIDSKVRKIESLESRAAELKKDFAIKNSEYSSKIAKSDALVEKYKNIAKRAVDKYIGLQSKYTGISSSEIKSRLSENYSLNDIDRVCNSLLESKISISKLPFRSTGKTNVSMKITESKQPIGQIESSEFSGDDIDDMLVALAKLN